MTENPLLREISLLKDKIDGMGRVILKAGCRLTVDETVCISELMRKSEALEQSVVTINNYLGSHEADLSGYVTLATQQNIWGRKNFDKKVGVGTRHPQNMLHINIPYEEYMGGIQITRGWVHYGDSDDGSDIGLNIRIAGSDALYSVSYTGRHFFNIETRQGVWETGMAIKDTPVNGPAVTTPQIVVGEPIGSDTGGSMGAGSINAESIYINGEPVVTGTFDPSDYYTKTNLQTSGGSSVHAGNITNAPWLTSLPSHNHDIRYYTYTQLQTSGQSQVHADNITNAPWLTSLPSHNHDTRYDTRYYTRTNLQTSGHASVHWGNVTNKPTEFTPVHHEHDTDDLTTGVLPVGRGGTGFSNGYGYVVAHGFNNPMDTIELIPWNHIDGKPSVFPPADHNHDDRYLTPFDQDLNTTDRVKFDGIVNQNAGINSYHYRSVASKEFLSPGFTATVKITMPQSWSNTVLAIKISGYDYSSATGWWECIVSGRNGISASKWDYPKCELRGNPPFSDVRLAHDGTKCCLLLGNTSTTWMLTNIHITDVITGYSNYSGWSTGWSIDLITNESGISNIATLDVDRPWHSGNLDPSNYAPVSHNHSASNITSGELSNSRLSFNPDYFVQGETIRRSCNYGASNPLNNNNRSAFYRLSVDDPSNPLPSIAYGIHINDTNTNKYGLDIVGRANRNKILWGGIDDGIRQPWREIHHSGVDYIKYDNNPAEVSHPTANEDLGTSNKTLNPTKGIYYAQGRSDTQIITMGNPQFIGQVVEIVHNGLQSLQVYCGPANPPMIINVPEYSILRLRAVSTPGYSGWSPVI